MVMFAFSYAILRMGVKAEEEYPQRSKTAKQGQTNIIHQS
jgi:hypothetical protein